MPLSRRNTLAVGTNQGVLVDEILQFFLLFVGEVQELDGAAPEHYGMERGVLRDHVVGNHPMGESVEIFAIIAENDAEMHGVNRTVSGVDITEGKASQADVHNMTKPSLANNSVDIAHFEPMMLSSFHVRGVRVHGVLRLVSVVYRAKERGRLWAG